VEHTITKLITIFNILFIVVRGTEKNVQKPSFLCVVGSLLKRKKMTTFILTVPHATCVEHPGNLHECDKAAPMAAELLADALKGHTNTTVVGPILGTLNRIVELDLSRSESREHKWRRRLLDEIAAAKKYSQVVMLVDVHSFDKHANWNAHLNFQPSLAFFDSRATLFDYALPEMLRDTTAMQRFTGKMRTSGSPENDIIVTAVEQNVMAISIDFSETQATDSLWLKETAETVAVGLIEVVERKKTAPFFV
jgi:hypothetical protein